MRKYLIIVLALISSAGLSAQEKEESKFGIKFSGFVKNDFFWDSRQTVAAREGHFLLWPAPVDLDELGIDINKQANFNFLAIQSRLIGKISGPDALGAKTSGLIEGDFFAQANDNVNLFRLRHAIVKLNWERLEVMAGQYWNPLFVTSCFPGTVSFNTGTPLQSFARNPQLRLTYQLGRISLMAAALAQRDYATVGPQGTSSVYLRNSAVPDLHFQIHYGTSNETGLNILTGAGVAYKKIVPRLSSTPEPNMTYAVDEKVGGLTAIGFAKLSTVAITAKLQVRYGENISDLLGISGFAATEIKNVTTGEYAYAPLRSMSFWAEVQTNSNPQLGIFGGFTSNNGTRESILTTVPVYGLATTIRSLYRIAPRIMYNLNKVCVAMELEYTRAAYGSDYDEFYIPAETSDVANLRILTSIYYHF